MQKLSLSFTQYINKKYQRTGRLWECRFHSCLIDKEVYLWTVCRYIERNPVRAGLIKDPSQYKWSSVKVNAIGQMDDLVVPIWKDSWEREEYVKFLIQSEGEDELQEIRKAPVKGRPIGGEEFINQIAKVVGIVLKTRPRGRPRKI